MFEYLRNLILIEERQAYENEFFVIEDILKSEELYKVIFHHEYEDESSQYSFDCEDYYLSLRDDDLIRERETYETVYFDDLSDEIIEKDTLDRIIESFDGFDFENDFDYEIEFENLYYDYCDHNQLEAAYCECKMIGYKIGDDLVECDYPEGPDENIEGIMYHWMECFDEPY